MERQKLAQWIDDASRETRHNEGVQTTLDEACRLAVAVVAGCRYAAISEGRTRGSAVVLAASDDVARTLHAIQDEVGDGPARMAIGDERVVWCDEMSDRTRWPAFAARASRSGVRSCVAIQLYTRGDTLGVLSLYSDVSGAFDEVTREVAQAFAAHIATVIAAARRNANLSRGLVTRQRIGQATGILAERNRTTTDQAFAMLSKISQTHNIRIRDLADQFVTEEDDARRGGD